MLQLYAQSFMIATRLDQPRHPDIAPDSGRRHALGHGPGAAGRRGGDLPRLGVVRGRALRDPL
jgi:hypothetical protein